MVRWLGATLAVLGVLLTASGCGRTAPHVGHQEAPPTPPLEETAARGAASSEPATQTATDERPDGAAMVLDPEPRAERAAPARSLRVVWTTDEPGAVHATPTAEPVMHEPLEAAILPPVRGTATTPEVVDATEPTDTAGAEAADAPASDRAQPMFFVFGEVEAPGPYKHTGRNRILDIVAQVQPTRAADPSRVMLIRPSLPEDQRVLTIDVDHMVRQGDLTRNVVITDGDILYVPASTPANIGHAVGAFFAPKRDDDAAAD